MAALFEEGFFVRKPAWHGLGEVLSEYPGREIAFRKAGHDFTVESFDNGDVLERLTADEFAALKLDRDANIVRKDGAWHRFGHNANKKGLRISQVREDGTFGPVHGNRLEVVNDTYTPVQNDVPWDVLDALLEGRYDGKQLNYETGGTLDGGAECFVTAWIDLPFQVTGDDSEVYPYVYATWRHDGLGAVHVGGTSVRVVCANTVAAARAEAEAAGHAFTFKHTKNVLDKIEDAKMAIFEGIIGAHTKLAELSEELGSIQLTDAQVSDFFYRLIPDTPASLTSERVQNNITEARSLVRSALYSRTVPEAHKATGWGLYNAGVEFFDHLRAHRTEDTYVRRTLYKPDAFKAELIPLIYEVADLPKQEALA